MSDIDLTKEAIQAAWNTHVSEATRHGSTVTDAEFEALIVGFKAGVALAVDVVKEIL